MIKRFALIDVEEVSNVILLDDEEMELIQSLNAIEIPESLVVGIGTPYKDGKFEIVEFEDDSSVEALQELSFDEIEKIIQSIIDENTPK